MPDRDHDFLPAAPTGPVLGGRRLLLLAVWAVASFGTCWFARDLYDDTGRTPLAYAVAGQGLLMLFIALVAANALIFRGEEEPADGAASGG